MTEQKEIFCNLIMGYRSKLFRMAKSILRNDIDAEDAVSETTYKAFANFNKLRNVESFRPWVMKILINESYTIANKRKIFTALDDDIMVSNKDSELIDAIVLWDAVQLLSNDFKTITILFYYENMSIKEISKILNIPQGTVNSRLNRSRKKLKEIFVKEGAEINES